MIANLNFIVFSDDWGRHPFSCMHIMRRFLPQNKVLWVSPVGMRVPKLTFYDIGRSVEKIISWFCRSTSQDQIPRNLRIISPISVPFYNIQGVRTFNRVNVVREVRKEIDGFGIQEPILITTLPNSVDYVGLFGEIGDIYYIVDDFTNWPGVNREIIISMEEELLERCNLLLASSEELCVRKQRKGKKPILLPHGVDFEHFNSAINTKQKPDPMERIPSPIIGFFGAISPWIDFSLIRNAAMGHPNWSFVFIGPVNADIRVIEDLKNVFFLQKISYQELPAYAAVFDAGIIPFRINELTVSVNPLKLLEYLACGLPVISTDIPAVRKYSDVVYIGNGIEGFLSNIEKALSENCNELRQKRIEIARNNSWDTIANQFSQHIEMLVR